MEVKCPVCGKTYQAQLSFDPNFETRYHSWKHDGQLIQNVWPDATTTEREQLMTGICSDSCWDAMTL